MKMLVFPELRQTFDYDCGAQALQAVFVYYGIELPEESIIKTAGTEKKYGTTVEGMVKTIQKFGLKCDFQSMTLKQLRDYIDRDIPVILLVQAWTDKNKVNWLHDYADGHYVVAIGYTGKKIFFEDPYTFERAFLTNKELRERWHDVDKHKQKHHNLGFAVYGKKPKYNPKEVIHMD